MELHGIELRQLAAVVADDAGLPLVGDVISRYI